MIEVFEALMLIFFGFSWPVNAWKSYKARTTKGKSVVFEILVLIGYGFGVIAKLINPEYLSNFGHKWYVLALYSFNMFMICVDLGLYARNRKLDRQAKDNTEG